MIAQRDVNELIRKRASLLFILSVGIWSNRHQAISPPRIKLSSAFFLTFMSGNFSFLKEMAIGCKTILLVFPVISQMSKFTFTEPIHSIISICIIKSIRRSTQGSTDWYLGRL